MIDLSELITNLVAILREISELVDEMNRAPERIYAYHDQYPTRVSLTHAIHQMPAPSVMAVWQGTSPGYFGGMDVWKHSVSLYLRAGERFDGDPPAAYYRLFRLITKGVSVSTGQPMINSTVHSRGAAFNALAKAYGKSVAEIQRMQRDGLIPGLQAVGIIGRGLEELTRFLNGLRENVPEIGRHIKAAVDLVRSLPIRSSLSAWRS